MAKTHISFTLNGDPQEVLVEPDWTLLGTIRDGLQLTGTKEGCSNGNCGACSVIVDGRVVNSCLVLAAEASGREITTVEGIAKQDGLSPLQQAFVKYGALQCGFCTPGFIVSATALLERNPAPSDEDIRLGLAGNLCRCTGYDKIVRAVRQAAETIRAR